jgi:hypothetical protein
LERFDKADYQENIWLDVEWNPIKLKKPARSIKGILMFCDLFGDMKFRISTTINNQLKPGEIYTEKGI